MVDSLKPRSRTPNLLAGKLFSKAKPSPEESPKAGTASDRLVLSGTTLSAKSRPTPIAPEGRLDYYQKRHMDFQARFPDQSPPSYYLGYGDVYVRRFTEVLSPELSKEGQEWMVRARKNLQVAIEDELAVNPEIELDDEAFTAFAYNTHSAAYLDAGLTDLPIGDLIRVAVTPNLSDTLNSKGIKVISETAAIVAKAKLAAAMEAPEDLAAEVLDVVKTSPDLLKDVTNLLDTAENARTLREGMLKLKAWPRESAKSLAESFLDVTTRKLRDTLKVFEALRDKQPAESSPS